METRAETLAQRLKKLQIGIEDVANINNVDFKVEERLIQVIGHFYTYDSILDTKIVDCRRRFWLLTRSTDLGKATLVVTT
jgi:hypothetical protein